MFSYQAPGKLSWSQLAVLLPQDPHSTGRLNPTTDNNNDDDTTNSGGFKTYLLHNNNEISAKVGGKNVLAKVDSGADLNFISEKLLLALPVHLKNKFRKKPYDVKCANQSVISCLGEVKLPVDFNGLRLSENFLVFSQAACDMFLGVPFLKKYEVSLTFSPENTKMAVLLDMPVHAENYFKINPHEEVVIQGYIKQEVLDLTGGHCFPFTSLMERGVHAAHEAVTVFGKTVPVRLYNGNRFPINIKRGERISTFRLWDNDTVLEPYEEDKAAPSVNSISHNASEAPNLHKPEPEIDWSKSKVTEEQKEQLKSLVREFSDCFVDPISKKLGRTDMIECDIETVPGASPVQKYPYRLAPAMREEMEKIIDGQLQQDLIEEAHSGAWASPALLVKKGSGGFRLVVDYRGLNAKTIPSILRIPRIDELLDTVGENQPRFFSVLDCTQGFHQIPLHPNARDKTGFITPMGKYRYKTMPQGFRNAPAVFQSLMDNLLRGIAFKYVMVYIDDLCIFSPTFEKHLEHLREVFSRIRKAKLTLHPKKCQFAVKRVGYLGHILTPEGISPNPDKISAIHSYPVPRKVKDVRAFLGMAGYYRKFVSNYSSLAKPLYELTCKDTPFVWSDKCQTAFENIKKELLGDKILAFPNFNKTFHLATDASKTGLGACLSQYDEDQKLRPVGFAGRGFTKAEQNYNTTEQECLAIVWAVQHFRVYLEGAPFELKTDHSALKWLLATKQPQGRLARWILFLQQFQYTVSHIKGTRNVVPDVLSRRTYDYTSTPADEVIEKYPDLDSIACNLENALTETEKDRTVRFDDTIQVIPPISFPQDHDKLGPIIHSQGTPVYVNAVQAPGRIHARRDRLRPVLEDRARELRQEVDLTRENIEREQHKDPQCKLLIAYLKYGTLPANEGDARSIVLRQEDYILIEDLLYHIYVPTGRRPSTRAQLVVPQNLKAHFLQLHHDNFHGGHVGVSKMTSIMKLKYFWIGMITDIKRYVLSCPTCQEAKPTTGYMIPPLTLRKPAPGPFHSVFIDTVGPLPKSQGVYEHLVCVTDQYSRYMVAWPQKNLKAGLLARKFYEKIICVYGAPKVLLSDNGSSLVSSLFEELCNMFDIKHRLSAAYHPQSQGQVERAQKSIVTLLRTLVNDKQTNWSEHLPSVLWALNTSDSNALGISPFLLLFGRIPHSPADMSLPEPVDMPQTVQGHYKSILSQICTASEYAEARLVEQQKKMKEYFDKNKATDIPLEVGDVVYVYQPTIRVRKTKKKLQRKFHGPFLVAEFTSGVSVRLRRGSDHKLLKKPVSIMRLKRGYIRETFNGWDPLEVDPEDEGLEEDDLPPNSWENPEEEQEHPIPAATQVQPDTPNVNIPLTPGSPDLSDGDSPTLRRPIRSSERLKRKRKDQSLSPVPKEGARLPETPLTAEPRRSARLSSEKRRP